MCLSDTKDVRVPTTERARETLALGGIGEKKLQRPDVDCATDEFHKVITNSFPKLRNSGGFELYVASHLLGIWRSSLRLSVTLHVC